MLGNVDLKFYLSIFLRRLPHFVVIVAFLSAIGIAVASILPPVYTSTASILVESQQIPDDLAQSTVPIDPIEQIQIIERRLMTRANILSLASRFDIYAGQPAITPDAIVADMRSRVMFTPQGGGRDPGATIIGISFSSEEPDEAADITNELVTLILQENVNIRTARAGDTMNFFEGEVDRLSGRMEKLSEKIMAFKSENDDALPDSLAFRRNQQNLLQERLLQLEREASQLQDNRARMVQIYERTGQIAGFAEALSPEEAELQEVRRELSRARTVYSPSNPNVRMLENRVSALEKTVAEQRALLGEEFEGMSPLDIKLAEIDGQLEFIAEERARMEAELAELQKSIEATPANALILEGMERDHRNVQEQYNAAVERLATASVGERIEVMSKGQRFSLIEPAVPPTSPEKPNRVLIAGAGVAGGLAAGVGFVILLELLNRSIRRPVELSSRLGIQPFATIPYIRTQRETRWKGGLIGGVLALIMVGIPVLLLAIHTYYLPIDLLTRQLLGKIGLGGIF